jgi:hypothetical protein
MSNGVSATSFQWWIFPPAITEQGEIDHDRLLTRVNKAFCLNALTFFTTGPYALLAPGCLSCFAFWGSTFVIQGGLWFDEHVTETVAAEIKAKKEENERNPPTVLKSAFMGSTAGRASLHKRTAFKAIPEQGYTTGSLAELAAK